MSALRPVMREAREAVLHGSTALRHRLHQIADNLDGHFDDIARATRRMDRNDADAPHVHVTVRDFVRNGRHDAAEFNRQVAEQLDALRNMSVGDWIRNRSDYLRFGRTPDSIRAQQLARSAAFDDRVDDLVDAGYSDDEAVRLATEWIQGQAATHRLDGIAGGNLTDIPGVGDAGVNSSLGAQWRTRVGAIDQAVVDFVDANPGVDLHGVYLDVAMG